MSILSRPFSKIFIQDNTFHTASWSPDKSPPYPFSSACSLRYENYKLIPAMNRSLLGERHYIYEFLFLFSVGLTEFKVEEEPHPLNPFLPPPKPTSLLDIASEVLGTITSRRSKRMCCFIICDIVLYNLLFGESDVSLQMITKLPIAMVLSPSLLL